MWVMFSMLIWRGDFLFINTLKRRNKVSANQELKKQVVAGLKEDFANAKSIIFVDYRGINVSEDTALRREFRKENVTYRVCKNNLLKLALQELGVTGIEPTMFDGTTAVAFSQDEVAPARVFCKASKDLNKMAVKFGIVDGKLMNKAEVEALAKIPSKEVLIAMLLGQLQAPISAFARALNQIAEKQN